MPKKRRKRDNLPAPVEPRTRQEMLAELYAQDVAEDLHEKDVAALQKLSLTEIAHAQTRQGPTPGQSSRILENVSRGGKISLALEAEGLPKNQLFHWFRLAKQGDPDCVVFIRELSKAVAEFELKLVDRIVEGGNGISGPLYLLQRIAPERWGEDAMQALLNAAKGVAGANPGGTTQVNTAVHIYLPDNGRGVTPTEVIDVEVVEDDDGT